MIYGLVNAVVDLLYGGGCPVGIVSPDRERIDVFAWPDPPAPGSWENGVHDLTEDYLSHLDQGDAPVQALVRAVADLRRRLEGSRVGE